MLLVIDIGNTNTSLGVFDGEHLVAKWRLTTARERTGDEWGVHTRNLFALAGPDFKSIDAIAIASVVPPLNFTLKRMAEVYFHVTPLFVDDTIDTGVPILYQPPSDVGADRIVDAVAAIHKYGAPCIVVDFGTSTNFDVISARGEFLGGVLAPGIEISVDALAARAAQLRKVELVKPARIIGKNTVECLQSGVVYGFAGQVDGLVRGIISELGPVQAVVATGGLAPVVIDECATVTHHEPWLTLIGLRLVFERNA